MSNIPICRWCHKTYSHINEPIYIVCLCDDTIKYAHGSCFREWLKTYKYGVCDICLTKTKFLAEEYKPLTDWKLPQSESKTIGIAYSMFFLLVFASFVIYFIWWQVEQCYGVYNILTIVILLIAVITLSLMGYLVPSIKQFWSDFNAENKYWKVVYCREVLQKTQSQGSIRRQSDVPLSLSEYPENDSNMHIENGGKENGVVSLAFEMDYINDSNDSSFLENNTFDVHNKWEPKTHLRIKKNPVFLADTFYASQSKQYITKQVDIIKNINRMSEEKGKEQNSANESTTNSIDHDIVETHLVSDDQPNLQPDNNFMSENNATNLQDSDCKRPDKLLVASYIDIRADSFYTPITPDKTSPSEDCLLELRSNTYSSNSTVNSNDEIDELFRATPAPFRQNKRKAKNILFNKQKSDSYLNCDKTLDRLKKYTERRRSLDLELLILDKNAMPYESDIEYKQSMIEYSSSKLINRSMSWQVLPNNIAVSDTFNNLPYTKTQSQHHLDEFKSEKERESFCKKQKKESSRLTKRFDEDPREVLQSYQKEFDKAFSEGKNHDLSIYRINLHKTESNDERQIKQNNDIYVPSLGSAEEINKIKHGPLDELDFDYLFKDNANTNKKRKSILNGTEESLFFQQI